ncbi:non-ribosomal peptide synthetase [Chitinophaga rhizophila]|uniref:Amino acid adenylation domain-containing protein n=1 Tax=Chitinophaga rhizophila TaxID=2866212 RepID=A0ABS7GHK9_9BACT|nr:non-ribosomal peptide synthetase [Chitinophaga rhizophila]MBW8687184.1 amino acid adenylation domain-containing protein [Chitinophaga rhizophila]
MDISRRTIAGNYWREKLNNTTVVNLHHSPHTSSTRLFLTEEELAYFNKLTAGNQTAAFTVVLTLYSILLHRYFDERPLILATGDQGPLLFAPHANDNNSIKAHLQVVKEEVKQVLKYADYEALPTPFESYTRYGLSYGNDTSLSLPFVLKVTQQTDLCISLYFREELVETAVAEHFLATLKRWLVNLQTYIDTNAVAVPLISEKEKQLLLEQFTPVVRVPLSLTDLLGRQVAATPAHIAVVCGNTSLTYKALHDTSNQFARYLNRVHHIGPGDRVGVKIRRDENLLMAILGILKSGAAYVPVDIDYPAERIAYIERDSQCSLVVDASLLEAFTADDGQFSADDLLPLRTPDSLAYLIYTSGTTGKPKGVMITDNNVVELLAWAQEEFDTARFEVMFAATSHCFDLSAFEMFYTLSVGKTIRVLENAAAIGPDLALHNCIMLNTVPSAMRSILEAAYDLRNVTMVNLAGEVFPVDIAAQLQVYQLEIRNLYGPSEDTTYSTCYRLTDQTYTTIPIGRPIPNTRAYILDDHGQLLPAGVTGKLYLSGTGLSKGYYNRPELTSDKFIPDPFYPGERMYDTGDLAKWRSDGHIAFLGRKDHQVKMHGYRIELGEIEYVMQQFDGGIRQAVVALKDVLIGYYVADKPIDETALRSFLLSRLPAYMTPVHFMAINSVPLSANGKTDRTALPAWQASRSAYAAPRNADETQLTAIWQEVLQLDKIGINETFFELGGNSLMIGQIINRMYRQMGKGVSFRLFYQNPTIASLARVLLTGSYTPVPVATHQDAYPATAFQRRLWLLSQLTGGGEAYRIFGARQLHGRLDVSDFQQAFAYVVTRHEILRTYFRLDDQGELKQYIHPAQECHCSVINTSPEEYIQAMENDLFDLSQLPLFRAALIRESEEKHVFFLSLHHILADGWSLEVLTREILTCYEQLQQQQPLSLPALPVQFKDYAVLESTRDHVEDMAYWKAQFSDEVPVLQLPSFKSRPPVKTFNGKLLHHSFSADFSQQLKSLARELEVTVFTLLMAGVKLLLSRYSNQYDITVGTPVAGREHPDLENQVGPYLNTLAVRTVFNAQDTFRQAVGKEQVQLLNAFTHQGLPFDKLVELLEQDRDLSRSPLFDVMVVLQNQQQLASFRHNDISSALQITDYTVGRDTSHFDLTFTFTEAGGCFSLEIAYNTDIYEPSFAAGIFAHFEQLITAAKADADKQLKSFDILTAAEKAVLLKDNKHPYPDDVNVVNKFVQQAAAHAGHAAVIFEDKTLSYAQLDQLSNQLAHYLIQYAGIQAQEFLPVQLERSEWMIVALLAIMKAGAVYVPVDPKYPDSRVQYILDDTQAKLVLNATLLNKALATEGLPVTLPAVAIRSSDLAYTIYTSGSTGTPKGVLLTHANLLNFLGYYNESGHRTALTANYVFDASVMEIFSAVTSGNTLVIPHEDTVMVPEAYAAFLYEHKISNCYMHPMHLEQIATQLATYDKVYLKRILFGVEGIKPAAVKWYYDNGVTMLNAYGPTEASIVSSVYIVGDPEKVTTANIPIGLPLPNYEIYILHEDTQVLQPYGAIGELCVAGPGIARGYLNREELTQEKFQDSAFKAGDRIYRTGDLARWLPDGNLEFIGRKDLQVKIRGNRVEPGEIEHCIRNWQPVFNHVLVEVREVGREKVLVAYYTSTTDIDKPALRSYLQDRLPHYMVPNYYVALDEIPLTTNGKIDRRKLPAVSPRDIIRKEFAAAANETEAKVAAIWQHLLAQESVSITDDFFELGGHSLLLTKLLNEYQHTFNVRLDLKELYAAPVLSQHALMISQAGTTSREDIDRLPAADYYELSPTQLRYWLIYKIHGRSKEFNIYNEFPLLEAPDKEAFESAFNSLIERHEILRTIFVEQDDKPVQKVLACQPVSIPYYESAEVAQREIFGHEFALDTFPLFRVGIVNNVLIFNVHHIISDGWSMGIIARDLMDLYHGRKLPALSIQYKDYAYWQNRLLYKPVMAVQEQYWKGVFSGELAYLQLPADYNRKPVKASGSSYYTLFLDNELKQQISALAARHNAGVFALFMAAFKLILQRLTGLEDIIVGIPAANRNHYQLKEVVGSFINTLMIRSKVEQGQPFPVLLQQVHQQLIDAQVNQNYPFERLIEVLDIPRDLHRFPLSSVFLNLVDFEAGSTAHIADFTPVAGTLPSSPKFDLECYIKTLANGISLHCVYDGELFRQDTIAYWLHEYVSVLQQLTGGQEQVEMFAVPLRRSEEQRPDNPFLPFEATAINQTIPQRFEQQVAMYPERTAVFSHNKALSYTELNNIANHLAQQLRAVTGGKQPRIALLLEHAAICVAGMLGTLKAGYAYVPIDIANPVSRIKYIVEDSGAAVLVCSVATAEKAAEVKAVLPGLTIVQLSLDISAAAAPDMPAAINPMSEAYVLYTSGSTGEPKGVIQIQRNVLHYIRVYTNNVHISKRDNLSLFSTYTFDASVKDIYGAILNGGCVSIYDIREQGLSELGAWLRQQEVSIIHMVPTIYRHFMKSLGQDEILETVRLVDLGGEPCVRQDLIFFQQHFLNGAFLVNDYGPTEATIISQKFLSHQTVLTQHNIPLGTQVTETEIFLLDQHNRRLGIYQEGEIAFSSDYLSLGYLNRPELTAKAFIEDPLHPGKRIYKSGDIGKLLPDGEIVFLQRRDSQVKLNGMRIELAEIEHQLIQVEGIAEAVVLLKEINQQPFLTAYIRRSSPIQAEEVKAALKTRLPQYMVPSVYVPLEVFPLTRTGKIDRGALPAPGLSDIGPAKPYVAPATDTEYMLAGIWGSVLEAAADSISTETNFFEAGGDSLQAVILVNRINKAFHTSFTISSLYDTLTIRSLANLLEFSLQQQNMAVEEAQDYDEVTI